MEHKGPFPRSLWLSLAAMLLPLGGSLAQTPSLPSASELLQSVIDHMPQEALVISGRLTASRGVTDAPVAQRVDVLLSLTGVTAYARYTLADTFGTQTEQFIIRRRAGKPPEYRYLAGQPPLESPDPNLFQTIANSEICWMDLSLGFLWWPGGKTIGKETIKDRLCYVVDVWAPQPSREQYSMVRLWIDEKVGMMLQADGYDFKGEMKRRVAVKSIKRIDERWMIKDLEIRSYPSEVKTFLRVEDARPAGEKEAAEIRP